MFPYKFIMMYVVTLCDIEDTILTENML